MLYLRTLESQASPIMPKPRYKTVFNQTKQTPVVLNLELADTFFTRFKGLMGRPPIADTAGLWITPCSDIHSCFMRFEFDAVFLDKNGTVLHLIEKMRPWRMSKWVKGAAGVLELNGGVIAKTGMQLGDHLVFQE